MEFSFKIGGQNTFDQYSLLINRGARGKYYETFETIDALKKAVSKNLTPGEIKSGVLDRLTTFNPRRQKDGYVENHWQNFSVCAYLA